MLKRIKGFTLIELLIVVAIIAILAAIAVPNFLEAQTRAKVSRVKNDQRTLATALESYYIDNNSYPAYASSLPNSSSSGTFGANFGANSSPGLLSQSPKQGQGLALIPTFRIKGTPKDAIATVTTPIAYITSLLSDPFADTKGAIFAYATKYNTGWLVWSYGPDSDENDTSANGSTYPCGGDIVMNKPDQTGLPQISESYYNPSITVPSLPLIGVTYDPSNGTTSNGDVWRNKQ